MRFICGILALLVVSGVQCQFLESGKQLKYTYSALVENKIRKPVSVTSQYHVNADLTLLTFHDGCRLSFSNVSYSLYNGEDGNITSTRIPRDDTTFNTPFFIKYHSNGELKEVLIQENDEKWAVQMKKALASHLQLDKKKLEVKDEVTHSDEVLENTHFGECLVNYLYSGNTTSISLTKWHDLSSCKGYKSKASVTENSDDNKCRTSFQDSIDANSEKVYEFQIRDSGLLLTDFKSINHIAFSYFNAKAEVQTTLIRQQMNLITEEKREDSEDIEKKFTAQYNTFLPSSFHDDQHSFQFYSDWDEKDIQYVYVQIIKHLEGMYENLNENLQVDMKKYKSFAFSTLMNYLRPMSFKLLSDLHKQIHQSGMPSKKIVQTLLYNTLPYVGTHDSVEFILFLIRNKSVKNNVAVDMIAALPFHVRKPNVGILSKFFFGDEFFRGVDEEVQYTGWLAFSTLLAKVAEHETKNHTDILLWINRFISDVKKSLSGNNYKKQIVLIGCLQNLLHVPHVHTHRVSTFIEAILKRGLDVSNPKYEAILTSIVRAGKKIHAQDDNVLQTIHLPILRNSSISSFNIKATVIDVLVSSPSMHIQTMLLWTMRNSTIEKSLKQYYYQAVEAFAEAEDPCLNILAKNARKIKQFLLIRRNYGSYFYRSIVAYSDYYDKTYLFGGSTKYNFIADSTNMPTYKIDRKVYLSGLYSYSKSILMRIDGDPIPFYQTLTWPKYRKNIEVEYFKLTDDCVTNTYFYSKQEIEKLLKMYPIGIMLSDEFNIFNDFYLLNIIQNDFIIPTDIGLPIRAFAEVPYVDKLYYNLTNEVTFKDGTDSTNTSLKASWNQYYEHVFGMVSYGPLADVWQGSRRVYETRGSFAIDGKLNTSVVNHDVNLDFNIKNPIQSNEGLFGIQTYVKNEVFIFEASGNEMFKKSCPECPHAQVAQRSDDMLKEHEIFSIAEDFTKTQHEVTIFDCDKDIDLHKIEIMKHNMFKDGFDIVVFWDFAKPIMNIEYWLTLLGASPEPGTCGSAYYIKPKNGLTHEDWFTSAKFSLREDAPLNISFNVDSKHGHSEIIFNLDNYHNNNKKWWKMEIKVDQPLSNMYKMCINYNTTDPLLDDEFIMKLHVLADEVKDDNMPCNGEDLDLSLSIKTDFDESVEIEKARERLQEPKYYTLYYDFTWNKLPLYVNNWAFAIEDSVKKIFLPYFSRTYDVTNVRENELNLEFSVKPNESSVIIKSIHESYGFFKISPPMIQALMDTLPPPVFLDVAFLEEKTVSNNNITLLYYSSYGEMPECMWFNSSQQNDGWELVKSLSASDDHPKITIFKKEIDDKKIGLRLEVELNDNEISNHEMEIITNGDTNHLYYDGTLLESGPQYNSVGNGIFKYKICMRNLFSGSVYQYTHENTIV